MSLTWTLLAISYYAIGMIIIGQLASRKTTLAQFLVASAIWPMYLLAFLVVHFGSKS